MRFLSFDYENDTVSVWPARGGVKILKGFTYLSWYPPFENTLFAFTEAANSWRTLMDLPQPDRIMLLKSTGRYTWPFQQLTSFAKSPKLWTLPVQGCFQTLALGSMYVNWQPYNWPSYCTRPNPDVDQEEAEWVGRFASFLHHRLPVPPKRRHEGHGSMCTAVVQLRMNNHFGKRESRGRAFLNSNDVVTALKDVGFRVIETDLRRMPVDRAGAAHYAAQVVVAPHGAGVANVMFSKGSNQTTLIELHNWGAQNYCYERFARSFGVKYVPLFCETQDQCPLVSDAPNPVATRDLCRSGVVFGERDPYYDSNHTQRDIKADIPSLVQVAGEIIQGLVDEGRCQRRHFHTQL